MSGILSFLPRIPDEAVGPISQYSSHKNLVFVILGSGRPGMLGPVEAGRRLTWEETVRTRRPTNPPPPFSFNLDSRSRNRKPLVRRITDSHRRPITDSNPKCGPRWRKRCSSHGGPPRPCTGSWARPTWRAVRAWSPSHWPTRSRTTAGHPHPVGTFTLIHKGASPGVTHICSVGTRAA